MVFNSLGRLSILALSAGFLFIACDSAGPEESTDDPPDDPGQVEVTVEGTVMTGDNEPINGANVSVYRVDEGTQLGEARTGDEGEYEVTFQISEDDTPDELRIEAEAFGFARYESTVSFETSVSQDVTLEAEAVETAIEGVVADSASGEGVEGAAVEVSRADTDSLLADTTTGSTGDYVLSFELMGDNLPDSLGLEATAENYKLRRTNVPYDTSLTQDFALPEKPIEIGTIEELQKIGHDSGYPLDGKYVLVSDIDASGTSTWNGGKGFDPIGDDTVPFEGSFSGDGYKITGLTISRSDKNNMGLFGAVSGVGIVKTIVLSQVDVEGSNMTGGVAGSNEGRIFNVRVEGSIKGSGSTGGIVGQSSGLIRDSFIDGVVEGDDTGGIVGSQRAPHLPSSGGEIRNSHSKASVIGFSWVGGLVGDNGKGVIRDSYATGNVEARSSAGGLAGSNFLGTIKDSYATGDVTGTNSLMGGLVGRQHDGIVENSYSTGAVEGDIKVGGLVGVSHGDSEIHSSYSLSPVNGSDKVGGLVGANEDNAILTESYAAGSVSGDTDVGGLIGGNGADVSTSYWDTEASGQSDGVGLGSSDGTTGLTTSEMTGSDAESNMDAFDFEDTWQVVTDDYPALWWQDL